MLTKLNHCKDQWNRNGPKTINKTFEVVNGQGSAGRHGECGGVFVKSVTDLDRDSERESPRLTDPFTVSFPTSMQPMVSPHHDDAVTPKVNNNKLPWLHASKRS